MLTHLRLDVPFRGRLPGKQMKRKTPYSADCAVIQKAPAVCQTAPRPGDAKMIRMPPDFAGVLGQCSIHELKPNSNRKC